MGMIWRSTMPLLSTLAALVIIVHSQEELERGYRRDLRPRVVDTASYEQPWKAIDMEPLVQHSTRAEVWNESPEEAPPRRRPVRKRKRRPQPYPDMEPQERHQESIQGTYHDADYHDSQQTMETARKRRKRPDISHQLTEEPVNLDERPLRRRGLRRKRPIDYDVQMAELISPEPGDDFRNEKRIYNFSKYSKFDEYDDAERSTENTKVYLRVETDNQANRDKTLLSHAENTDMTAFNRTFGFEEQRKIFGVSNARLHAAEPESSSTLVDENDRLKTIKEIRDPMEQSKDDNADIMVMIKKSKENGVIDPMMLKQILKRSNGSSLSEMLQRHNLSLTDLLQGRDEAISALNAEASEQPQPEFHDDSLENTPQLKEAESKYPSSQQSSPEQKMVGLESNSDEDTTEPTTEIVEAVTDATDAVETENQEIKPRMSTKRRFPTGIRRKLRMRPTLNSTLKAQLSRDLIALSARKYSRNNRNVTKSREWKDVVPLMVDRSKSHDETSRDDATEPTPTTTEVPVDTTIASLVTSNSQYSVSNGVDTSSVKENDIENTVLTTTEPTTTITIEVSPSELTERPKVTSIVRPAANNSALRRQAFNNRLKRKRLKQISSTTEDPNDDLMKNFLGMANLVSASHFIERTQKPYTTVKQDNTEFATELEDFLSTHSPGTVDGDGVKSTNVVTRFTSSTTKSVPQTTSTSTTEQSAKFEIEEILNDTMTSERLAKILRERNMTLNELVNHRERGSSHVHLADIFHNASKEPNPPEPFLTKSSIEPISKETYPLRAILEANTHETTTRPTSSQADQSNQHIPVVMDFGNNVNENGESMGIISLFKKFTDSDLSDKTEIQKDSDGTPYVSSVISVNATNANDTNRESRLLTNNEDWKVLLSFMKEHNISTFEEDLQTLNKGDTEKESLEEDLDGDPLMVLEDVQHLQNFDSNIASGLDENVEVNMYERRENLSDTSGILHKIPSNTKSVAIATASILGLAAILFLLTYIAFKWKQQRDKLRNKLRKKESFCAGPIPSPVFENRKGHKHNCSSRSISPMISNTNIYMSTLDSRNGKESPDYTWNSLRKPFQ